VTPEFKIVPTEPRGLIRYNNGSTRECDYHERFPFSIVDQFGALGAAYEDYPHSYQTLEEAEAAKAKSEWYVTLPVGRRKSHFLTEVRTVLSRADTCVARAEGYLSRCNEEGKETGWSNEDREILEALEKVSSLLSRWERTGPTPKYPGAK
jgi:hypothetical protein